MKTSKLKPEVINNSRVMKNIFVVIFLVVFSNVFSQFEGSKQIFESANLTEKVGTHKTIAIVPFEAKISYKKQPKNYSAEGNREQQATMSRSIQSSMYTFLLRKKDMYFVDFQDV